MSTPLQPPENWRRILIVDDDPEIVNLIRLKFELSGFEVWSASSGEQGLALIHRQGLPHLALVDLDMPGMNGFEFCENVLTFSDLPVIILTANTSENTIVEGIERFAEDYVTKPFSPRELVARVQRVLRRIGDFKYTLAPETRVDKRLSVDFAGQRARVDDTLVELTPTETKLLYLLMRNAGAVVQTDFLLRRLWPEQDVFEDSLRVHIRHVRQKIELDPSTPNYVLTERGLGYRFVLE